MINILDTMCVFSTLGLLTSTVSLMNYSHSEELRATPEKLATHISNKHFLAASTVLTQAVKSVTDPDMNNIGALDDLRRNLVSQVTVSASCSC